MLQSPSNAVFGSTLSYTSFTTVTLFRKTTSQCHLNISLLLVCIQKKKLTRQIRQTCFLLCLLTTLHDEFWTNTVNGNWTQNSQFKFQAPNRFHMTNIQLFTISLSEEILICLASMDNVPNMSAMQLRSKHKLVTHLSSCCQH